jgi:hypothetical protein
MAIGDLGSATRGATLTPSDTVKLNPTPRAIRVGTGGNVKITTVDGDVITIPNVQDGETLYFVVLLLWSTGTTATGFTAYY